MATATTIATADCDVVDTKVDGKPAPTQLCMFSVRMTPSEMMDRTSKYASDPAKYLVKALGSDVFDQRRDMLSLQETVDVDVYGNGAHKEHFEHHIAKVLGKQHGLFFITGVQAQLAAMKIYSEASNNKSLAWHVSSHLESAEERAFEKLYGLERMLLGSNANELPTVDEIKSVLASRKDHHPAAILVEIPNRVLGCKTYAFSELEQISAACREAGVKFHCDGARLWEGEAYYQATAGKSFKEVGELFDSVYVSFYKGLRGITGAILASNDASFIAESKTWQRRAGGNAYTLMYEVIDCERGYNENIGTFAARRDKMSEIVDQVTAATGRFKAADGQKVVSFVPEKATCCQIHTHFRGYTAGEFEAARDAVQQKTNVRVFERLRPKQTVDEMMKEKREASRNKEQPNGTEKLKYGDVAKPVEDPYHHFMEWMIMSVTEKIDTKVFVDGYVALCEELESSAKAVGK